MMPLPGPKQLLRLALWGILLVIFINSLLFFIGHVDVVDYMPEQSICPIKLVTGHECPGCGMTRAFLKIGQLRFFEAFSYNPFSYLIFLTIIVYLLHPSILSKFNRPFIHLLLLVAAIVFWVYRLFI